MDDKRRTHRLSVDLKIACAPLGGTAQTLPARTRDIGRGGLLIEAPAASPLIRNWQGELRLPESGPVAFEARTAWSRSSEGLFGLAFTHVAPGDRERLERFLRSVLIQTLTFA
jgi:hypothetical protein